ncbi:MAG: hypothetical protein H0T54_04520 [Geodermatophilaceae bacterium]|nr:hypothetical protein [Geodermatophilaceae bacterium]
MKFAELIAARMQAVDALEKRMMAKPTADLAEKLGKATLAAHAGRIEQRIARLDRQRATTLARIDTALETEHAALAVIRKMAEGMPAARPGKETKPSKPASVTRGSSGKKATASKKAAASKKPVRAKPAKPA